MSLKGHLDLKAGLVCQGQPSTWDKDCRRSFPAEGSTLDLFGAAVDCHSGQRPWPQSQAVAMDAAPASLLTQQGSLDRPHVFWGQGQRGEEACVVP